MKAEALEAGLLRNAFGENIQKIQISTIKDLLNEVKPDIPSRSSVFEEVERESVKKDTSGSNTIVDDAFEES